MELSILLRKIIGLSLQVSSFRLINDRCNCLCIKFSSSLCCMYLKTEEFWFVLSKDCSFGSEELWGHKSISCTTRDSREGAWRNSKSPACYAGIYLLTIDSRFWLFQTRIGLFPYLLNQCVEGCLLRFCYALLEVVLTSFLWAHESWFACFAGSTAKATRADPYDCKEREAVWEQ